MPPRVVNWMIISLALVLALLLLAPIAVGNGP